MVSDRDGTDRLLSASRTADEVFGEARLVDLLRRSAGEPAAVIIARVFEAIDGFAGNAPQFDDCTMLMLRRE